MTTNFESLKLASLGPATPSSWLVRLEGGPASLYEGYRLPGMCVRVRTGGLEPRVLPLASQPGRTFFEALLDRSDPLAGALEKLRPGDVVEVGAPFGAGFPSFEFRRHDLYLAGNGLGLGVVRAAVLHALTERGAFDRIRVLTEARFVSEIPFRDELPSWQRAGAEVYQVLARPDMGKWRRSEGAYLGDLLRDLRPDPAKSAVFASGTADMLEGAHGALRAAQVPAERVFFFEVLAGGRERALEAARPTALLEKITAEGVHGSGHQKDAPDHAPAPDRAPADPREQPRGSGLAPYQLAVAGGGGKGGHY